MAGWVQHDAQRRGVPVRRLPGRLRGTEYLGRGDGWSDIADFDLEVHLLALLMLLLRPYRRQVVSVGLDVDPHPAGRVAERRPGTLAVDDLQPAELRVEHDHVAELIRAAVDADRIPPEQRSHRSHPPVA